MLLMPSTLVVGDPSDLLLVSLHDPRHRMATLLDRIFGWISVAAPAHKADMIRWLQARRSLSRWLTGKEQPIPQPKPVRKPRGPRKKKEKRSVEYEEQLFRHLKQMEFEGKLGQQPPEEVNWYRRKVWLDNKRQKADAPQAICPANSNPQSDR